MYEPGLTSAHPIPQATIPDWKYCSNLPGMGQTSGDPPSPLHVSLPRSPPVSEFTEL